MKNLGLNVKGLNAPEDLEVAQDVFPCGKWLLSLEGLQEWKGACFPVFSPTVFNIMSF
eukprot:c8934_g1_i1 orf=1-171(-)